MTTKERYAKFVDYYSTNQPEAETELHYSNPYELIVAVSLSAQCTDKRVNMCTPAIFRDFPTPEALARADYEILYPYIKSISYPSNKTKHLLGMAKMLVEEFNSTVPADIDQLQKLPGVGRKTANVIASVIFNKPTMAVDTHVFRVSKRIGLVPAKAKTPLEVEKILVKNLSDTVIPKAHHWLILLGRYICLARNPKCDNCSITDFCKYYAHKEKIKTNSKV
jgi:endonuclease-3